MALPNITWESDVQPLNKLLEVWVLLRVTDTMPVHPANE